ncbi:hypothetical protein PoB_002021700 [Plakobranchus ocellatus]|uniref:Uncharacterized protein n=1 Tax=Plakobranchus ocellatus TaxID=259542 RepID=A0AAV3ZGP2_9GAST|nr:hypothetical protein PoB_002021700 [Plakobranchus ocellatus]
MTDTTARSHASKRTDVDLYDDDDKEEDEEEEEEEGEEEGKEDEKEEEEEWVLRLSPWELELLRTEHILSCVEIALPSNMGVAGTVASESLLRLQELFLRVFELRCQRPSVTGGLKA